MTAGMKAGVSKFVTINVGELGIYEEGEEVSLNTLAEKNLLTVSGRQSRLPLKVRPSLHAAVWCRCPSFLHPSSTPLGRVRSLQPASRSSVFMQPVLALSGREAWLVCSRWGIITCSYCWQTLRLAPCFFESGSGSSGIQAMYWQTRALRLACLLLIAQISPA